MKSAFSKISARGCIEAWSVVALICGLTCLTGCATDSIKIGIAYGTEKKDWLEWAVQEFKSQPDGRKIEIELIPKGSIEGAHAILSAAAGNHDDQRITVWAPASKYYYPYLERQWKELSHTDFHVAQDEEFRSLVSSPLVLLFWNSRYQALKAAGGIVGPNGEVGLKSLIAAAANKDGWGAFGAKYKPWRVLDIGVTDPRLSNSALMTLIIIGYEATGNRNLQVRDLGSAQFNDLFEPFVASLRSDLPTSTEYLLEDFVRLGPGWFDVAVVYENLAVSELRRAASDIHPHPTDSLTIVPMSKNVYNDHPWYVLDVDWSTKEQQEAAKSFGRFLKSGPAQRKAAELGFHPSLEGVGMPAWYTNLPNLGFCDTPDAGVIPELLTRFDRARRTR